MSLVGDNKYKERSVIGFVEPVICVSKTHKEYVRARIDSGATKSSIDTSLAEKLGLGPVLGEKRIRNAHGSATRKLVEMTIHIAGKRITEKFTLADRASLRFPVLVGRNILRQGFLIDPNKKIRKSVDE